jgi:thymidine kinase
VCAGIPVPCRPVAADRADTTSPWSDSSPAVDEAPALEIITLATRRSVRFIPSHYPASHSSQAKLNVRPFLPGDQTPSLAEPSFSDQTPSSSLHPRRFFPLTFMAKLYFYYSAMNAGKSTLLLQSSYNYRERGMNTALFTPGIDTRGGPGRISSRIGLTAEAIAFAPGDDLNARVRAEIGRQPIACVLVDEAQFLTRQQVQQLAEVVDLLDIPVLCYGLRTDFQGNLFEGSASLLAWADDLNEIKTICHCGRKATMVLRTDAQGRVLREGAQIEIGGNERYVSVCRRHFKEGKGGKG